MEEADGRFGHGDASMVAHAFLEQHFCDIGHKKKKNQIQLSCSSKQYGRKGRKNVLLLFFREKQKEGKTLGNR